MYDPVGEVDVCCSIGWGGVVFEEAGDADVEVWEDDDLSRAALVVLVCLQEDDCLVGSGMTIVEEISFAGAQATSSMTRLAALARNDRRALRMTVVSFRMTVVAMFPHKKSLILN